MKQYGTNIVVRVVNKDFFLLLTEVLKLNILEGSRIRETGWYEQT